MDKGNLAEKGKCFPGLSFGPLLADNPTHGRLRGLGIYCRLVGSKSIHLQRLILCFNSCMVYVVQHPRLPRWRNDRASTKSKRIGCDRSEICQGNVQHVLPLVVLDQHLGSKAQATKPEIFWNFGSQVNTSLTHEMSWSMDLGS
jgi:hypothetical protein